MNNLTELNYKEVNKMLTVPVFLGQYLVELSASSRVLSMTCRCDFLLTGTYETFKTMKQ